MKRDDGLAVASSGSGRKLYLMPIQQCQSTASKGWANNRYYRY